MKFEKFKGKVEQISFDHVMGGEVHERTDNTYHTDTCKGTTTYEGFAGELHPYPDSESDGDAYSTC